MTHLNPLRISLAVLAGASLQLPSQAARLAYEGFEYTEADGTALSSLTLPGGTGWDGNYGSSQTATTTPVSLIGGLTYTGLTSASGSKAMKFGSSNTLYRPWDGSYATPGTVTDGTYWYSVLFYAPSNVRGGTLCAFGKPTDPQNGIGVRMDRGSDVSLPATTIRFEAWGDNGGGGNYLSFENGYDKTYFILGKLVVDTAGTSTNRIWIYQSPAALPTTEPTTGGITMTYAPDKMALFRKVMSGRAFSTGGNDLRWDEFRVGETFSEAFPLTNAEFSLSPASAVQNQTLTFTWTAVPATATSIELDPGDIDLLPSTTGGAGTTTLPAPAANTIYSLTFIDGGSPVSLERSFTAIAPSFTVPATGYLGDTLSLSWQVPVGSTAVTLTPGPLDLTPDTSATDGKGTLPISAPSATTTYTLSYTYNSVVHTIDKAFTLLPSFVNVTPEQAIYEVSPLTIQWRIDPAFSVDPVSTDVVLEVGPAGGPYSELPVTTDPNTGAGTYSLTPLAGEAEYRIRYHLGGVPKTLTDTVALYPKVFTLGTPVNNTKPVVTNLQPMFDGVTAYSDRGHVWAAVPTILQGAQFAKLGNDDKNTANLEIPFTAVADGTFFLLIDNRIGDDVGGNNPAAGTDNPPTLGNGVMDFSGLARRQ